MRDVAKGLNICMSDEAGNPVTILIPLPETCTHPTAKKLINEVQSFFTAHQLFITLNPPTIEATASNIPSIAQNNEACEIFKFIAGEKKRVGILENFTYPALDSFLTLAIQAQKEWYPYLLQITATREYMNQWKSQHCNKIKNPSTSDLALPPLLRQTRADLINQAVCLYPEKIFTNTKIKTLTTHTLKTLTNDGSESVLAFNLEMKQNPKTQKPYPLTEATEVEIQSILNNLINILSEQYQFNLSKEAYRLITEESMINTYLPTVKNLSKAYLPQDNPGTQFVNTLFSMNSNMKKPVFLTDQGGNITTPKSNLYTSPTEKYQDILSEVLKSDGKKTILTLNSDNCNHNLIKDTLGLSNSQSNLLTIWCEKNGFSCKSSSKSVFACRNVYELTFTIIGATLQVVSNALLTMLKNNLAQQLSAKQSSSTFWYHPQINTKNTAGNTLQNRRVHSP